MNTEVQRLLVSLPLLSLASACASTQSRPAGAAEQPQPSAAREQPRPSIGTAQTQPGARAAAAPTYQERYRPQYHFAPAMNWMNDPNGMVYYAGEYHLFYQYNPFGDKWGHMSWGHAVSRDLVHWEHLPVAIPEADNVMAFSGSAVVDWNNTSGFGKGGEPPLVAIYTGHRTDRPSQSQYIAYSTDRGRTWTRYAGNPVLDIGSAEFRDPKVFWYEPHEKWVMAVVLATEHKVSFYSSPDLKRWTHLSNFGPAGAVGGVWECPDLFPLPVDGNPNNTRWVLVVNMNPGGIAGGSGVQYFVGNFDGTTFTPEGNYQPIPAQVPAGTAFADFEGPGYGRWVATGNAYGERPARGAISGQSPVSGFQGTGLINTYLGGDAAQGTLTSPEFTISSNHINFLIGGGNHPAQVGMSLLVGGREVRTATGRNAESLDWQGWDVRDLRGQKAQIQIFDRHTGGWGHINVDQILFSDEEVRPAVERALWADYGKDFYAAVTWSDIPRSDGRRIWIGWMSNWQYANDVPTSPWRSAMSLPRTLALRTTGEGIRLVQQPVAELQRLRGARRQVAAQAIPAGTTPLASWGIAGKALEIVAEFEVGTASELGLKVRTGREEETVIGIDPRAGQLFVDRTRSGKVAFHGEFGGRQTAPLPVENGRVRLHVWVDWSSVEVFARDGQTVITDLILPAPESEEVAVYANGGTARLVSLEAWPLESVWKGALGQDPTGSR